MRRRWLLLSAVLYLAAALWQLTLPGPHYDEVVEILPILQILHGQPAETFRNAGVLLAGNRWPLMTQDYIGAFNTYLVVPYLLLVGVNVVALRLMPITLGLLTLWLAWSVAATWYDRRAANITVVLLATMPSFVFWTRQGIFVTSITQLLALLYVLFLWRWWQYGRLRDLLWAAWWAGWGLYAKFLFLWILTAGGALVLVALLGHLVFHRTTRGPSLGRTPSWGYVLALGVFLLALSPLLHFNWQTSGTLETFTRNLTHSYYGVDNTRWWANLGERWGQLRAVAGGGQFWYLGGVFSQSWTWRALWGVGGVATLLLLGQRRNPVRVLVPHVFLTLVLIQSTVTVSALWPTHFAILVPFVSLALAISLAVLARAHPRAPWLVVALVILLVLAQIRITLLYHRTLARSGGLGDHSDAIYHLADLARSQGWTAPLALDWGLDAPLTFLTNLRVNPIEVFGYERLDAPDSDYLQRLQPFLDNPDTVFLAHDPQYTVFRGRVQALQELIESKGWRLEVAAIIRQRDGTPLFQVLRTTGHTSAGEERGGQRAAPLHPYQGASWVRRP